MIESERWYTIKDLQALGAFPWIKSYQSYWNLIKEDLAGDNLLGIKRVSGVKKNSYLVQGKSIKKFLNNRLT